MRPPWFPSSPAGSGAIPCALVRDGLLRRDAAPSCLHSAGRVSAMLMPVAVCAELLGRNVRNGQHLVLYCCMDHDFHDLFVPLCRLACLAALQSARSIQAAREGADAFDYPEHGAERMSFLFLLSVSARTLAYMPLRALVRGPHTRTLPQAVCVCVRVYGYMCVCFLLVVACLSFLLAHTFSRSSLLNHSLLSATIAPPQFTLCRPGWCEFLDLLDFHLDTRPVRGNWRCCWLRYGHHVWQYPVWYHAAGCHQRRRNDAV